MGGVAWRGVGWSLPRVQGRELRRGFNIGRLVGWSPQRGGSWAGKEEVCAAFWEGSASGAVVAVWSSLWINISGEYSWRGRDGARLSSVRRLVHGFRVSE